MARIVIAEESIPATPSSGSGTVYVDATASKLTFIDDAGRKYHIGGGISNAAIANQTVNAADTYLTDSDLLIPSFGLQARNRIACSCAVLRLVMSWVYVVGYLPGDLQQGR